MSTLKGKIKTKSGNVLYPETSTDLIVGLADVAKSGSYTDLTDKPTIPTVNDATLTITQNGTSKGTFTANSSTDTTIALSDTTYENKAASSGGTDVSLVTTGEKYIWNNMLPLSGGTMSGVIKAPAYGNGIINDANNNPVLSTALGTGEVGVGNPTHGLRLTTPDNTDILHQSGYNSPVNVLDGANTSANPTLYGNEPTLSSLKLNGTNYAIPTGPSIPTPTSADAGKVMQINSSGNYSLVSPELPSFQHDEHPEYFTVTSKAPFTVTLNNGTKCWDGNLYISNYQSGNTPWDGSSITVNNYNDTLGCYLTQIWGAGNTYITGQSGAGFKFQSLTTPATVIHCCGNVNVLLDTAYYGREDVPLAPYAFKSLFGGLGSTTVDFDVELPSLTLAELCYNQMFAFSTITKAPKLPATTLADGCYSSMFSGCKHLIEPPELPATTLVATCYVSMFDSTNITKAPKLPATTLADGCYDGMFSGCKYLTELPELPAMTLTEGCYLQMFRGCTSIRLSATQTSEYTNAYRIPSVGTGTDATHALYRMFRNTGGTFADTPTINTTYYTSNKVIPATSSTGGVTSFGGTTGAITLGSGLSMVGNQLTLSITSYDGTVIELGYSGNITAQLRAAAGGAGTYIKFGSAPTSANDYDSSVNSTGTITGDTTYSNETKVYVWGNSGVIINGVTTSLDTGVTYDNAEEVVLTGDYNIVLIYSSGGGSN